MEFSVILNHPENGKILLAAILGALIGLEREISGKDPSLRTFSLICVGSCTFAIISRSIAGIGNVYDSGRIAAQIVVGIGFLGAGTIYRSKNGVSGLTTAALMWVTAAIGTAIGFGLVAMATSVTLISLGVTFILTAAHRLMGLLKIGKSNPQSSKSEQV